LFGECKCNELFQFYNTFAEKIKNIFTRYIEA